MAAKALKLSAVPAALGLASFRVNAVGTDRAAGPVSTQELSIYTPASQPGHFVEEEPGQLQKGLEGARVGLQPYIRAVKGACISVKIGTINLYHAGEDIYHYLRDPPPEFLPRVSLISVSALAGLVLVRKGSRVKRLGASLGLAALGTAVCYPAQAVSALKLTAKKTYAVGQWTAGAMGSLWKPSPVKRGVEQPGSQPLSVPSPVPEVPPSEISPEDEPTPVSPPDVIGSTPVPLQAQPHQLAHGPGSEHCLKLAEDPVVIPVEGNTLAVDPESPEPVPTEPGDSVQAVNADTHTGTLKKPQYIVDPKLMDHGQSSPEDADLYSTRS